MKRKINLIYFIVLFALLLNSCAKFNSTEDESKNVETLIFENKESNSENPKRGAMHRLDSKLDKSYLINYDNNVLHKLRSDNDWSDYIRKQELTISKNDVIKSLIKNTNVIMYSIPYTSKNDSGYLNVYSTNNGHFWTKVSITKRTGNLDKYTITTKDGNLIMQLNLNGSSTEISNVLIPENKSITLEYKKLGEITSSTESMANCNPNQVTYSDCLKCLIEENCSGDAACEIDCAVIPAACLGTVLNICITEIEEPQQPYGQCGGREFPGPYSCQAPFLCVYINEFYSQCLPN